MFIAFEGIDGSGKSTQLQMLQKYIEDNGGSVYVTREPSDLSIGKTIRRYLTGELKADNRVIAALFVADRLEHILDENDGLLAKINSGTDVLCDRYYFSSYAYQSVDMPMEWIINANSVARELLKPDATIFIDVLPEKAMERINANRESAELFENVDRLRETRSNYFKAFEKLRDTEKVIIIDGHASAEEVHADILSALAEIL